MPTAETAGGAASPASTSASASAGHHSPRSPGAPMGCRVIAPSRPSRVSDAGGVSGFRDGLRSGRRWRQVVALVVQRGMASKARVTGHRAAAVAWGGVAPFVHGDASREPRG